MQDKRLSRREREMMDVIHKLGRASAAEVRDGLADPPSYSAVRATLRIMEDKGLLTHEDRDGKYIYRPLAAPGETKRSAMRHLLDTFFAGSAADAAAALLGTPDAKFTRDELTRLEALIAKAKKEDPS